MGGSGFPLSQLVAASLAMMIASGALAWSLRPLAAGSGSPAATSGSAAVVQASLPTEMVESYAEDLARLEDLVEEHRSELDPNTLRILEKNLAIIDRAIEESGAALLADPSNEYLREHLSRSVRPQGGLPPRCLGDLWLVDLIERWLPYSSRACCWRHHRKGTRSCPWSAATFSRSKTSWGISA